MKAIAKHLRIETNWPPSQGQVISFTSSAESNSPQLNSHGSNSPVSETAILKEVRWGLVWRDFVLEDGRVIPEHRVFGCPQPQVWRNIIEVTEDEREQCEERLLSMAGAGMDPRKRDQSFWTELNQYLAYTYLRFKQTGN